MQGFAELEYGMLRYMGAIDDSTPVVTSGKVTLLHLHAKLLSHSGEFERYWGGASIKHLFITSDLQDQIKASIMAFIFISCILPSSLMHMV